MVGRLSAAVRAAGESAAAGAEPGPAEVDCGVPGCEVAHGGELLLGGGEAGLDRGDLAEPALFAQLEVGQEVLPLLRGGLSEVLQTLLGPAALGDFYAQVKARWQLPDSEIRLRKQIVKLKELRQDDAKELGQLRTDVEHLVRVVNQLSSENRQLRNALAQRKAAGTARRRRGSSPEGSPPATKYRAAKDVFAGRSGN
ncbi:hypothetical protein ACIRPJ_21605 [Streptomyces asoensis]|uniref:hypothetical protein n=1 Tax=Streptomyces asoensis TaxID=249586 RepID=UPI001678AB0B|nr:hypothetical protein [Streptomyces asoensis]GGQ67049.1 hypothetical protein GCM10010496_33250 [Streptomyces asoensis]